MEATSLCEQEAVEQFLSSRAEETFSILFRAMAPRLVCYFRARGCQLSLAEDLTQDVMLIVYNQSHTLRNRELFRPWLFKIAKNTLLQHLRREGRQVETIELDARLQESAKTSADPLTASHFAEWMASLDPNERELMMLRYVEGFEYHEIAAMLGLPIGTVQWKVFQSKRKLAARFGSV